MRFDICRLSDYNDKNRNGPGAGYRSRRVKAGGRAGRSEGRRDRGPITGKREAYRMKDTVAPPYYLQIALDIAARVARGEFREGQRIFGRSVMASEYSTSPETIRRALRLLADTEVVEILPQSGTIVLSAEKALGYIRNFEKDAGAQALNAQLQDLMKQYAQLNRKLLDTAMALIRDRNALVSDTPLPNYEVTMPDDSPLAGKSLEELKFWQATGATIIAIKRGQDVVLSPGPYAKLYAGDIVIDIGTQTAADAACRFVHAKEELDDPI